jgi:hypothetical protein
MPCEETRGVRQQNIPPDLNLGMLELSYESRLDRTLEKR